jgi:uncharacterized protein (DUF736 family)
MGLTHIKWMETRMIIGRFKYDGRSDRFQGGLVCLNFQMQVVAGETPSDRQPEYLITAQTTCGSVEIGSAWKRTSERGTPYLSVVLDAPLLAQPLHAALFVNAEGDEAVLIWNRSRPRSALACCVFYPRIQALKGDRKRRAQSSLLPVLQRNITSEAACDASGDGKSEAGPGGRGI